MDQVGKRWICGVGDGAGVGGLAGADGRRFCKGDTIGRVGVGKGRGCECVIASGLLDAPDRRPGREPIPDIPLPSISPVSESNVRRALKLRGLL